MLRWSHRLLFVWVLLCTSSCAPVMGAVASGGVDMIKSAENSGAPNDELLTIKVKAGLAQKDVNHMFSLINVKVETHRVMLTGVVQNAEIGNEAVQIAQGVDGVTQVINELTVSGSTTAATATGSKICNNDDLITNEILNQMLINKEINAVNYSVDTINGVVYVIGTAETPQELEAVLNIANSIQDVKRVINHVLLKTDSQQTPAPATQQVQGVSLVPTVATAPVTTPAAASVPSAAATAPVAQTPGNTLDAELAKQQKAPVSIAAKTAVKPTADNAPVNQPVAPIVQTPANTLDAELANQQKAKDPAAPVGESLSEEQKTSQLNKLSKPAKVDAASTAQPAAVVPASQPTATAASAGKTTASSDAVSTQPTASPTDASSTDVSTDKRN